MSEDKLYDMALLIIASLEQINITVSGLFKVTKNPEINLIQVCIDKCLEEVSKTIYPQEVRTLGAGK